MRQWLFTDKHALHGVAASRVLGGIAVLGVLLTNFSSRTHWVSAKWAQSARDQSHIPFLGMIEGSGDGYVTVFFLVTLTATVLFTTGWHARATGVVTLVGFVSLVEQNPLLGDQGDNILRIGLTWLLFMHTTEVWAVGRVRPMVPAWLSNSVHNIALCALAAQVLIVYASASLYKLKGSLWRDGTALFYPLQLPQFRPLPALADLLIEHSAVLAAVTYGAVAIQLLFPLMLLHRTARRVGLILIVLLHTGIAIVMGLPWFSLSMVAFDAIFVSRATYVAAESTLRRWRSSFARQR